MMRPCPNCGELTEESANFCHLCGDRLIPPPPPPPALPPPAEPVSLPRKWRWLLAILVLGALASLAAMLVLNDPAGDAGADSPMPGSTAPDPTSAPSSPPSVAPAPAPGAVLASSATARVTVTVNNCAGCEVTAVPADGTAPQSAVVAGTSVTFTLANRSTLGLALLVSHPGGFGSADGPNAVVLAPTGAEPGATVPVSAIIDATTVGVCWAGTVAATAAIPIAVDPFADGTPTGGLRAWADPAQQVLKATTSPESGGSVEEPSLARCQTEWASLQTS